MVGDERAGVLRGVRFGETGLEVLDRLGSPTDEEVAVFPAAVEYTGPRSIKSPRGRVTGGGTPTAIR